MGKRYREKEERKELQASISIGSTSSDDIMRFHELPVDWESYEEKTKGKKAGKIVVRVTVKVRGQDVFARRQSKEKKTSTLWEKFLIHMGYANKNLISLTNDAQRLSEQYYSFLVDSYTPSDRYHNLDFEGKVWLRKIVRLAVDYHIMENKLEGYLRSASDENDDEDYFYNEFALYFYLLMRSIKRSMQGAARIVHHLIEEPEKADYWLKVFFDEHYNQLRQLPFPQRDNILRLLKTEPEDDDEQGVAVV